MGVASTNTGNLVRKWQRREHCAYRAIILHLHKKPIHCLAAKLKLPQHLLLVLLVLLSKIQQCECPRKAIITAIDAIFILPGCCGLDAEQNMHVQPPIQWTGLLPLVCKLAWLIDGAFKTDKLKRNILQHYSGIFF